MPRFEVIVVDSNAPAGLFAKGGRVHLRPVEDCDHEALYRWLNDPELRPLIGSVLPEDRTAIDRYIERLRKSADRIWFMIALNDSGRVIGETGLLRVNWPWRTADVTMIIGERDCWGRGLASEAMELLLDLAFGELGLHRLAIGVVAGNQRALRWWAKMGFCREGVQRDGYWGGHRYQDFVMMSLLAPEYRAARGMLPG